MTYFDLASWASCLIATLGFVRGAWAMLRRP